MLEFSIGAHKYKARKLDTMKQWGVARRIAPVVTKVMDPALLKRAAAVLQNTPGDENNHAAQNLDAFLELIAATAQPFMDGLAEMGDEDSEYVINTCAATVQREQPTGWADINPGGRGLMFDDIDLPELIQIVVRVILGNVANFSPASLSFLVAAPQA